MGQPEVVEELERLAAALGVPVADAQRPIVTEPLRHLEAAATRAQKAWSGSWFGYHSRVYYKDFIPPPAGAVFSSE